MLLSATVNEPVEVVSIPAGSSGFGYPIKAPWLIQLEGQPNSRETRAHSLCDQSQTPHIYQIFMFLLFKYVYTAQNSFCWIATDQFCKFRKVYFKI